MSLQSKVNNDNIILIGKICPVIKPFVEYPESSNVLNIFEINILEDTQLIEFNFSDILCKGIVRPMDDKLIVSPILHFE